MPKCPEYASGNPSYHSTVYIDIANEDGDVVDRRRVMVHFDDRINGTEIIGLAMAQLDDVESSERHADDTNKPLSAGNYPVENSAFIGETCYG